MPAQLRQMNTPYGTEHQVGLRLGQSKQTCKHGPSWAKVWHQLRGPAGVLLLGSSFERVAQPKPRLLAHLVVVFGFQAPEHLVSLLQQAMGSQILACLGESHLWVLAAGGHLFARLCGCGHESTPSLRGSSVQYESLRTRESTRAISCALSAWRVPACLRQTG